MFRLNTFFVIGRKTYGKFSIKILNLIYGNKNFYAFITEKEFKKFLKFLMGINSKRVNIV